MLLCLQVRQTRQAVERVRRDRPPHWLFSVDRRLCVGRVAEMSEERYWPRYWPIVG